MKRSARQARATNILDDLACLRTANSPGSWRHRLEYRTVTAWRTAR